MDKAYYRYWGKARRDEIEVGDAYHLLPYHCLDVAACGYWLVKHNRFGAGALLAQLGWQGEEGAIWFAWLLGLHDIGKFARGFQQLSPHPALVPPLPGKIYQSRHDALGYWLWNARLRPLCKAQHWSLLAAPLQSAEVATLDRLMALTTGHHGKPPPAGAEGIHAFDDEDIVAAQAWIDALTQLLMRESLPSVCVDKRWRKELLPRLSWPLAGLIVLADWLGSNQHYFPYEASPRPLADYWAETLLRAEQAAATLPAPSLCADFAGITSLFPFIRQPTPLQQLAAELPLSPEGGELLILEDVTGAGKSEAALILASRLMAQGKGSGLYIGLPTMATANAMFDRLQQAYRALFSQESQPSLMLAHGARELNEAFRHSLWEPDLRPGQREYGQGEAAADTGCHRWFADSRKKALLAEVGVGTLDQALMAVLPFRHQSLRMLGLHGKVLLLDEVHAYDAYMNKLLERLLTYHASQGGSAIILSATLSQPQRRALTAAFALGRGEASTELDPYPAYPLLTRYSGDGIQEWPLASRPEVCREVAIRWLHQECDALASIRAAVTAGQCVAWIRNTVDDAIRAYQALATEVAEDQLLLFHSRFAFVDRLAIEAQVMAWCGKASDRQMRRGRVVIATQVIEQSMDLDFDQMLTDLAPIDLLVQRAGRLQRHVRDEAGNPRLSGEDGRPAPQLLVLAPEWTEDAGGDWLQRALPGTGHVYPDHGQLWLSQQILRRQQAIRMPEEARLLIDAVYGDEPAVPVRLQARSDRQQGKHYSERACADSLLLSLAQGYQESAGRWQEEIDFSTRLGEPTITLLLAYRREGALIPYATGPFAWEMSRLQVRETLWRKVKADIPHLSAQDLPASQPPLPPGDIVLLPDGACTFYSTRFGFQP